MEWWFTVDFGRFVAQQLYLAQHSGHLLVTFWNSGAHGPISDFFTTVGHNAVHVIRNGAHGTAWIFCKGRHIEVPVTKDGIDVSSCR